MRARVYGAFPTLVTPRTPRMLCGMRPKLMPRLMMSGTSS